MASSSSHRLIFVPDKKATNIFLRPRQNVTKDTSPVLLVIADGVGVAPDDPSNAVTQAPTPTLDALTSSALATTLLAHGPAVGLPSDDDMGNSEVGHNALGAGRIFDQGAKLVNAGIADGSIFQSPAWNEIHEAAVAGTLHLIGLHSDGNVHASLDHLHAIVRQAAATGIKLVRLHLLLDGRDVGPRTALDYLERTEEVLATLNAAADLDYRIASGGGRMTITMDRYGADWAMVERGYNCHTHGIGRRFRSAAEAVTTMYSESNTGDQYLGEFVIVAGDDTPVGTIVEGDAVVLFNFRGDRAIEISQAYELDEFEFFDRGDRPTVTYAGMLQYDGDALIPARYLVTPPAIDRTMSEFLCAEGVTSFAISETQKFGHVTYFWNGNRTGYIDNTLETFVEIPSDNVEFNTTPGMKLREITEQTIEMLRSGRYKFGRLNFPNGDMVGHTGDLKATIEAMRVLDQCMEKLVEVIDELGGVLVYTADHGNADIMYTEADGIQTPKTSHTLSPVPFAIHDASSAGGTYELTPPPEAGLSHVASTLFNLLGYAAPSDYQPSLISYSSREGC
ncbi:MAG: 2,3-bisphosphoglycerate-independent phosphoglycerate mutase [Candidatus Poriferisodalaceae bacterium]|jgi:2,3-bisphosphoglycerate-independent phosphoglycerate mutase